ncbi:hypothetical protein NE454_26040, partial [Blautia producta]|uniref:hypothetical protein n=1 Tax=Blautia producta TaxID=33035 RepID=UPI002108D4C4
NYRGIQEIRKSAGIFGAYPMTSNPQPKPYHSFSDPRQIRLVDMFPYKKNRAFRKGALMALTSQKARKYATFWPLFIFS